MTPIDTKEAALEAYDRGEAVYLLYPDNTEGMAESRSEIENFEGYFGIEKEPSRDVVREQNYYDYSGDLWYDGDQIIHRRIIAFEIESMMREIFSQAKHIVYSHRDTQIIVPYSLRLTDREKSIICKRYGMFQNEILSYEEISQRFFSAMSRQVILMKSQVKR